MRSDLLSRLISGSSSDAARRDRERDLIADDLSQLLREGLIAHAAVDQRDERRESRVAMRVRDDGHAGVAYPLMGSDRELHLLCRDANAADLDQIVDPPLEGGPIPQTSKPR